MWKVDISICGGGRSTLASMASCLVHLPAGHSRYWTGHGTANSGKDHTAPEMRKLINKNNFIFRVRKSLKFTKMCLKYVAHIILFQEFHIKQTPYKI